MRSALVLFLAVLLASTLCQGQGLVRLDVKTKSGEKADLAAAKAGTIICLNQSDWAEVGEYGEDFSLWLKDYQRVQRGKNVEVTLVVELRTPAAIRSGRLLTSEEITVEFDPVHPDEDLEPVLKGLHGKGSRISRELQIEAAVVGRRVEETARDMVRGYRR